MEISFAGSDVLGTVRHIHKIKRFFLLQCQQTFTHFSKRFCRTPKIVPRNSVVEPQFSRAVLKCTRNITSHSTPNGNSSTSLGNSLPARQPPFFSFLPLDAAFAIIAVLLSLCVLQAIWPLFALFPPPSPSPLLGAYLPRALIPRDPISSLNSSHCQAQRPILPLLRPTSIPVRFNFELAGLL